MFACVFLKHNVVHRFVLQRLRGARPRRLKRRSLKFRRCGLPSEAIVFVRIRGQRSRVQRDYRRLQIEQAISKCCVSTDGPWASLFTCIECRRRFLCVNSAFLRLFLQTILIAGWRSECSRAVCGPRNGPTSERGPPKPRYRTLNDQERSFEICFGTLECLHLCLLFRTKLCAISCKQYFKTWNTIFSNLA